MDGKDKLILFELLQDCRQSVSKIVKLVGLPQQTVDKRIKKLEKSKVIKKYALNINYPKFGLSRHSIYLDCRVPKEDYYILMGEIPKEYCTGTVPFKKS